MQVADQTAASGLHVGVGFATHQGGRAQNEDYAACYVGPPRGELTIGLVGAR